MVHILRSRRTQALLPVLAILALALSSCTARPPVPRAAVRLTLTLDGLLQSYADNYALSVREPGSPKEIAEAYLRRYQPGPLPRVFEHSVVYDRSGTLLAEWIDEGRRTWIPLERISPHLVDAILATEDATFFGNQGIDAHRLVAAVIQNASSGGIVSGASTITMQLARNLFFPVELRFDQSVERKAFEALLAQDLARLYTKDEILEIYLNLIFFGHHAYGAEAAAQTYFGKPASELTLAEAALLAGIPQAPSLYDPYINPEAAKARQRTVLNLLVRHNYLNAAEADAVYSQPITLAAESARRASHAPHFVQFVRDEVQTRLGEVEAGRAGLRLVTTLDLPMQKVAESIVRAQVDRLRPSYDLSNAALVALKPGSAEVLVMVGSANYDDDTIDGKVNVAASLRQPGSAIKPVLYATALNDNVISPASVLWDVPASYKLEEGTEYTPQNYDEEFHGPVTARTALANSYNIPAIKLLDAVGVPRMLDKARAMGLTSLREDASVYGLSLTLGGGEVRLIDLATAFHTLADGGRYVPYALVLSATASDGQPVALFPPVAADQVLTPAAAFQVTSMLSDEIARRPAFGANSLLNLSRPAAGKTGTTTSYRDNWTIGFTRFLVVGVWAGNSDGRPMRGVTGVTGAGPIWHDFMEAVIADAGLLRTLGAPATADGWAFEPPATVEQSPITCPMGVDCAHGEEYFSKTWLARYGHASAQAADVAAGRSVLGVVAGDRIVGGCISGAGDTQRTLLRLPSGLGQLSATPPLGAADNLLAITPNIPVPVERPAPVTDFEVMRIEVPESVELERQEVITWTLRTGNFVNLGYCDGVGSLVARITGGDGSFSLTTLPESGPILTDTTSITATDGLTGSVPAAGAAVAASNFQLIAAGPGGGCSGNQILGIVTGADGAPLSGVRIVFEDQYGNRGETLSKGGGESGRFDFAVGGSQNAYFITLIDASGAAISPTAMIQHTQPGEGNACYWAQFQAAPG